MYKTMQPMTIAAMVAAVMMALLEQYMSIILN